MKCPVPSWRYFTPLDYTFLILPSEIYYLKFTFSYFHLSWVPKLNVLLCFWHCAGVAGPIFLHSRWLLVFTHHRPSWSVCQSWTVFIPFPTQKKDIGIQRNRRGGGYCEVTIVYKNSGSLPQLSTGVCIAVDAYT